MSIEFLLDSLKEEEKERLQKVIQTIKQTPRKPVSKEAVFLKKFTLALMRQYPEAQKKMVPQLQPHLVQQLHQFQPRPRHLVQAPHPLELLEVAPIPLRDLPIPPEPSTPRKIPKPV